MGQHDDVQGDTEAAVVASLATRVLHPQEVKAEGVYHVLVPDGHRTEVLDLDEHLPFPRRTKGTYRPATVEALINHIDRHFDCDRTTIWVHPTSGRVTAVFNDATPASASDFGTGWRDHRSQLDLKPTPEWLLWTGKSGQLMSQVDFAEHIEDGVKEIVEPAAADMLELAQTFHATQSGSFRSAHRLHDGTVQVHYDENVDATAGRNEDIPIPTEFQLAIAPFVGEDPYRVTARLRYRLTSGTLRLGYRLDRPDDVVRDALSNIADRLTEKFTHVFLGEPAA